MLTDRGEQNHEIRGQVLGARDGARQNRPAVAVEHGDHVDVAAAQVVDLPVFEIAHVHGPHLMVPRGRERQHLLLVRLRFGTIQTIEPAVQGTEGDWPASGCRLLSVVWRKTPDIAAACADGQCSTKTRWTSRSLPVGVSFALG